MQVFLDIILVILAVDFGSGMLHWLEDSYGQPHWPITGKWITAPNILHHQAPSAFTENSWLLSAAVLLVIGAVIIGVAWLVGMLTWQFLLFVAIGVNANEIHKWNRRQETGAASWWSRFRQPACCKRPGTTASTIWHPRTRTIASSPTF